MKRCRIMKFILLGLLLVGLLPLCAGATHQRDGWDLIRSENFDYYYRADREPFPEKIPFALERLERFYKTVAPSGTIPRECGSPTTGILPGRTRKLPRAVISTALPS